MKIEDVIKELEEAQSLVGVGDYIDEECIKAAIDFLTLLLCGDRVTN